MTWMTADGFRAALGSLGLSQSAFARRLQELGDPRPETSILRSISSYCAGSSKVPGEMHVVLRLLGQARAPERRLEERVTELEAFARQQASAPR